MALVQGIYDLGKPGREQSLYTNHPANAALIQENFVYAGQSRNAITFFVTPLLTARAHEALANMCAYQASAYGCKSLRFVL
jgi:hypothetical protein